MCSFFSNSDGSHYIFGTCFRIAYHLGRVLTQRCRSIFIASWGALLFSASGFVLQYVPNSAIYGTVMMNIGWVAMVTGFSFVLYSRLHFLNPKPIILRVVLMCIIIDALLFHVPIFVTTILSNVHYTTATWKAYMITSYTEIAFTVQETLITTLYVYLFLVYTKDRRREPETKLILWQLFAAEFVVFSTDIILNVLLYTENYLPRQIIQSFASVLKLRIEFAVLNSLIRYSQSKSSQQMNLDWQVEPLESPVEVGPMSQRRGIFEQPWYGGPASEMKKEARHGVGSIRESADPSLSIVPVGSSDFQSSSSSNRLQFPEDSP